MNNLSRQKVFRISNSTKFLTSTSKKMVTFNIFSNFCPLNTVRNRNLLLASRKEKVFVYLQFTCRLNKQNFKIFCMCIILPFALVAKHVRAHGLGETVGTDNMEQNPNRKIITGAFEWKLPHGFSNDNPASI